MSGAFLQVGLRDIGFHSFTGRVSNITGTAGCARLALQTLIVWGRSALLPMYVPLKSIDPCFSLRCVLFVFAPVDRPMAEYIRHQPDTLEEWLLDFLPAKSTCLGLSMMTILTCLSSRPR